MYLDTHIKCAGHERIRVLPTGGNTFKVRRVVNIRAVNSLVIKSSLRSEEVFILLRLFAFCVLVISFSFFFIGSKIFYV